MIRVHYWGFVFAVLFVCIVQSVWNATADVIWFESARTLYAMPNEVHLEVRGYKVRDCRKVEGSEVGFMRAVDGDWVESEFSFAEKAGKDWPAMYMERISFGTWKWRDTSIPKQDVAEVMATVAYNCGDDELLIEEIGPFKS